MVKKVRGLGRGLDALFSGGTDSNDDADLTFISVNQIRPRDDQPRKTFDQDGMDELTLSIKEHGLLQPLLVRKRGEAYEIIAGERRWRAASAAGLNLIPVLVKESDDLAASEIALIENLQREDLTIIEEALAYQTMMDKFGYTQEKLAERIGKSRSHVANSLRILGLPEEIIRLIQQHKITPGHARAILSIGSAAEQIAAAHEIMDANLSVREAEKKAKKYGKEKGNKAAEVLQIEDKLQKYLGTMARISYKRKGGKIEIAFFDDDDLERLIELLGIEI